MKGKSIAWRLVLCLLLTRGMEPTYGAVAGGGGIAPIDSGVIAGNMELNPADGSISVPVEMDATIIVSLTPVSLSADGSSFAVNPEQIFDISTPAVQITSPDVTVVNHSVMSVKPGISSVPGVREEDIQFSEKFSDDVEQSFRLVDTLPGVGPPGIATLVLGTQDRVYSSREESERYAIRPSRTGILVTETPVDREAVIELYGKVSPDLYSEFEFTVKPTLRISTVRVNKPADLYRRQNKEQKKGTQGETKVKRTKKMAALILSMAVSTVWVGTAYGVEAEDPVKVESADGDIAVTLTGTVKVATLSATVPITMTSDTDVTAVSESGDISKVDPQANQSGPDTYKIINNSASSVRVYVNSVSAKANAGGSMSTPVNEYKTLLTDSYGLMLIVEDAKDDTTPLAMTGIEASGMKIGTEGAGGDWMLSGSKSYFMNSEYGKLIVKDQVSGVSAGKNETGPRTCAYTREG